MSSEGIGLNYNQWSRMRTCIVHMRVFGYFMYIMVPDEKNVSLMQGEPNVCFWVLVWELKPIGSCVCKLKIL